MTYSDRLLRRVGAGGFSFSKKGIRGHERVKRSVILFPARS